MKAIVIQHDGSHKNDSYLQAVMKDITRIIIALLGAVNVDVNFFDDTEVATALLKSTTKKNSKTSTPSTLENACQYVFHLYGDDVLRIPSESIEKDMIYHILSRDDIHAANLLKACEVIKNDKVNAKVWFTNAHAGSLLDSICRVVQMVEMKR